jgi:hypothetical protein
MAMQQDAAERVREMQRRARQRMEQGGLPRGEPALAPNNGRPEAPPPGSPPAAQTPLTSLFQDNDRMILLLLLLLLSQEKADPSLMMALIWLML